MAIFKSSVEHFTPSSAELLPFHKIHCQEAECKAIFTNFGNYDLHLQKHHKIIPQRTKTINRVLRMYHCPESGCVYNSEKGETGRHFKHMKNLRQHFQKVHVKSYICENCGRTFPTQGQFQKHVKNACGKRFNCTTCGWDFETKASLALHGKRKGHQTQMETTKIEMNENIVMAEKFTRKRKSQINYELSNHIELSKALLVQNKDTQTNAFLRCCDTPTDANIQCGGETQDCETQTEYNADASLMSTISISDSDWHAIYQNTETQTDTRNALEDFQALQHHDIETQTEKILQQRYQPHSSPIISNSLNSGGGFLDHMLSHTPLTHMHTQTCEDYLLSELGLSDIQTQTNWSAFNDSSNSTREYNKHMYATTSTSTSTGFAHDELLVSTETQTSFTQCLLDSTVESCTISSEHATTCNTGCGTGDESNTSNYVHLYNTQHTQTCDLLLEGLFGSQENDLIAGFQSTYTQT